eukprot:TRINITY_DN7533_c1_g3_i1.p1 TRINITY_DN7533_c1_g3~~TRINITY_DN7533_c1_g3_i1.p1  ORF type:complete len:976 (-),score=216.47 TRINITY_DN7533_c1_g3_i1:691-3618(-)
MAHVGQLPSTPQGLWPPVMRKFFSNVLPGDDFIRDDPYLPIAESSEDGDFGLGRLAESSDGATEEKLGGSGTLHDCSPWMKLTGFKEELLELRPQYTERKEIKIVAGTWNVAGLPPTEDLSIDDWLRIEEHPDADIYVMGFQEIVPLNANNVLGLEDEQRAHNWNEVLRHSLNRAPGAVKPGRMGLDGAVATTSQENQTSIPSREEASEISSLPEVSEQFPPENKAREEVLAEHLGGALNLRDKGDNNGQQQQQAPQETILDDVRSPDSTQTSSNASPALAPSPSLLSSNPRSIAGGPGRTRKHYYLAASRQMVGIHLAVWVRSELRPSIRNVKVSVVGVGIMNLLGNKGSVALSLTLHETTFCFMCAHLSAGEKEMSVQKRLQDAQEVLRRTHFTWSEEAQETALRKLPETVEMHDRVIWVGDFNFRVDMPDALVRELLAKEEWAALLEKDQLFADMHAAGGGGSGVFKGWQEGEIRFAPTYKYVMNAAHYVGDDPEGAEKRRTPAWCDRVLWHENGLQLLHYGRSEVTMSDHRPVTAVFRTTVEVILPDKWRSALDQACSQLDNRADKALPRCHVEPNMVEFGDIKYAEERNSMVVLHNTGSVPLKFSVGLAPDDEGTRWLAVSPSEGELQPAEEMMLTLRACITVQTAEVEALLDERGGEVRAIHVLKLEGGDDHFLFTTAKYLPSCWGISLERLATLEFESVRTAPWGPIGSHVPLVSKGGAPPVVKKKVLNRMASTSSRSTTLPKEVRRMVQFLTTDAGMDGPWAFDASAVGLDKQLLTMNGEGGGVDGTEPSLRQQASSRQSPSGILREETDSPVSTPSGRWRESFVYVSWSARQQKLEQSVSAIREYLDRDLEFPHGTDPQLVGTALVLFLRALPRSIISPEIAADIDEAMAAGREDVFMLEEALEELPRLVLLALLVLIQPMLPRVANQFAVREIAQVLASAIFPQEDHIERKRFHRRVKFLQQLRL